MYDKIEHCAETRWFNKTVYDSKILYSGNQLEQVELLGTGELELVKTSSGESHLLLTTNTQIENINPRPYSIIKINLSNDDLSAYNRVCIWVYLEAVGYQNFYFHFSVVNSGVGQLHAPSLEPNKWNQVIWETGELDCVSSISINPLLMGCPPEALPTLRVYIKEVKVERVDADYDEGWQLDTRIAYCHSGYFSNASKVAITQEVCDQVFRVFNHLNEVVFLGKVEEIKTDLGFYYQMDFSTLKNPGEYYLQIDNRKTEMFLINDFPYLSATWKSMNFLKSLRCGEDVPGVHSPCHLNCRTVHEDAGSVPNFGGWHDAGDLSQFEICTAEMAHAILDLAEEVKDKDYKLYERLLEEGKVGVHWLLRTRFGDGSRALAVSYKIWRDNVLEPDNKTVLSSVAENGPFENFCASAAQAVAARLYLNEDKVFSDWCLRAATKDFEFAKRGYEQGIYTKRWGPSIDSQVCGVGILAACELYEITNDDYYIKQADLYANIVLACQQSTYPDWEFPLRGFFYEDPKHTKMLTYEHRGHEQSPIQGLARLCEVAPRHPNYANWIHGLELYQEYILATSDVTEPYGLIPAHVYDINKINLERFTIPNSYGTKEKALDELKQQIMSGIKLSEGVYLRTFPIAISRRGFHATLLSKTKGITSMAKILKDPKLYQIAINQLEWVLGKNPFASSTMYGEGHNYHPLYVAFSKQLVGALPVGIKTLGNHDAPYWPVINNAVYKEIWGHTTGKFLWVLANLIDFNK